MLRKVNIKVFSQIIYENKPNGVSATLLDSLESLIFNECFCALENLKEIILR